MMINKWTTERALTNLDIFKKLVGFRNTEEIGINKIEVDLHNLYLDVFWVMVQLVFLEQDLGIFC